jgi:hypothetical protein
MTLKDLSISWLLHSIKILLGDESIRRYIILNDFPKLKHQLKKDIRTFDPFVKKKKTRQDKYKEIEKYLDYVIKLKKGIVVFTATNVQQNDEDNETHFQTFIVDNDDKKVYAIDPAYDKDKEDFIGIYYAEVTHESIKPFLESKGYEFKFIPLSRPAQSTTNDVFCQSWSLLILLDMLHNNRYKEPNVEFKIPKTKPERYQMLLDFYKDIFIHSMPELLDNLQEEYIGSIKECYIEDNPDCPDEAQKEKLMKVNIGDLLRKMKKSDV